MSEGRHVTLASTSNAEDAAWLAVFDVAASTYLTAHTSRTSPLDTDSPPAATQAELAT